MIEYKDKIIYKRKMEQSNIITNFSDFNANDRISFGFISELGRNKGKKINIYDKTANYNGCELFIQTPVMSTWGISAFTETENYKLGLSFPSSAKEEGNKYNDLYKAIEDIENLAKKYVMGHVIDIFGINKKLTEKDINMMWVSGIKYPKIPNTIKKDLTKNPTFSSSVSYYEKKWNLSIYDLNKTKIFPKEQSQIEEEKEQSYDGEEITPVGLVPKGSLCIALIKPSYIYQLNEQIGLKWALHQIVVKPSSNTTNNCDCIFNTEINQDCDLKPQEPEPVVEVQQQDEQAEEVEEEVEEIKEPVVEVKKVTKIRNTKK
jgi:hypothetical protein